MKIGQLVEVKDGTIEGTCIFGRIIEGCNPIGIDVKIDDGTLGLSLVDWADYEKVEMLDGKQYYIPRNRLIAVTEAGPGLELP